MKFISPQRLARQTNTQYSRQKRTLYKIKTVKRWLILALINSSAKGTTYQYAIDYYKRPFDDQSDPSSTQAQRL